MILLARLGGLGPPTCGLEVRCSIQLSYGRWAVTLTREAHPGRLHTIVNRGKDPKDDRGSCRKTRADNASRPGNASRQSNGNGESGKDATVAALRPDKTSRTAGLLSPSAPDRLRM